MWSSDGQLPPLPPTPTVPAVAFSAEVGSDDGESEYESGYSVDGVDHKTAQLEGQVCALQVTRAQLERQLAVEVHGRKLQEAAAEAKRLRELFRKRPKKEYDKTQGQRERQSQLSLLFHPTPASLTHTVSGHSTPTTSPSNLEDFPNISPSSLAIVPQNMPEMQMYNFMQQHSASVKNTIGWKDELKGFVDGRGPWGYGEGPVAKDFVGGHGGSGDRTWRASPPVPAPQKTDGAKSLRGRPNGEESWATREWRTSSYHATGW